MDFATIASLRQYLSVKHSSSGALKVKFAVALMKDPQALKLAQSPPEMPAAVTKSKLNLFARTLSVEYDAAQISPVLLEELITTDDDNRAAAIVERLHSTLYS